MLNVKKTITLNGQSMLEESGQEVMVASMTATLTNDGVLSVNKSIVRPDLYEANKEEVKDDMTGFDFVAFDLETTE